MTTFINIKTNARIFLTDYASYNNGTQFEFGHWIHLDDFNDADELNEYIQEHFKEADGKSPLYSPREEVMITDYEGFPEDFYSESMDFELLYYYFDRADSCYYDSDVVEAFACLGILDATDVDTFFNALENTYVGEYASDEDLPWSY
jgi:hypothetical protein